MKAFERYVNAVPGPSWTLGRVVQLGEELLSERGDIDERVALGLMMLHEGSDALGISRRLAKLRLDHWSSLGKKPPESKEVVI